MGLKFDFVKIGKDEFGFSIDGEDLGTIEKTIDHNAQDAWKAIDCLDGWDYIAKTKQQAAEHVYYRILAFRPDGEGNKHSCESHPNDVCIKCLYINFYNREEK